MSTVTTELNERDAPGQGREGSDCSASEARAAPQGRRPLPPELGYCEVFDNFLSAAECRALIERAEQTGLRAASDDYPPSYRNNDRLVVDDPTLAAQLFERLARYAPHSLGPNDTSTTSEHWVLSRLNERIRFCRYRAGQEFTIHQDGVYHADEQQQSRLTFMIYLTAGEDFEGGDTLFYTRGPTAEGAPAVVARVRPRLGTLILFDHNVWHAGEPVRRGQKYIVRSDVLYRRLCPPGLDARVPPFSGHRGYVWTLAQLPRGIASGGRDRAIRLWSNDGAPLGALHGHQQSVLGLAAYGDGQLASVSRDRTLKLWHVASRRCRHSVVAHQAAALSVTALNDHELATGGGDGVVQLWSSEAQNLGSLRGHTGWVWGLAALPKAGLLASASEDTTVRLWSVHERSEVFVFGGKSPLRTLAVATDQSALVTGDTSGRLHVWTDLLTSPRLASTFVAHDAAVRRVVFLDADTLASAGEDGYVRCWRLSDQTVCAEVRHQNFATDVLPVSAGHFVSCSYDGSLRGTQVGFSVLAF